MKNKSILIFVIVIQAAIGYTQDCPCVIVKSDQTKNTHMIRINGENYIAASEAAWQEIAKTKSELEIAQIKIKEYENYIAKFDDLPKSIESVLDAKNQYIKTLEEQIKLYEQLVEKYRKLRNEGWLSIEIGGGFTGNFNPAAVAGISIFDVYIMGFLQLDNPGCFVGLRIPIF